jgi:hypothetical protein
MVDVKKMKCYFFEFFSWIQLYDLLVNLLKNVPSKILRQPESTQAWWDEKKSYMASHGWEDILCGLHWFATGIKWVPEVLVWKWSANSKNSLNPCGEKRWRWIVLSFPRQLPLLRTSFCCQSPVVWRGYKVRSPIPWVYGGFYTMYYKDIGEFQILYLQDICW